MEPIRADSLILLRATELVFHSEFQVDPKPDIPFRLADYYLRIYRRFPDKTIKQIVIYLRPSNSPLIQQTTFQTPEMTHCFHVLRLWE